MSKKSSFKRASYKVTVENERQDSLKKRKGASAGYGDDGLDGRLNNTVTGSGQPVLTQFVLETWDGGKIFSKDYTKEWYIDDHSVPIEALYLRYETHPGRGLKSDQIKRNLESHGKNVIFQTKKSSQLKIFCEHLLLGLNLLLWICGVVSILCYLSQYCYMSWDDIVNDNLYSGIALFIVVFIAGCFSYYQQYKSNRILESFRSMIPQTTMVWRNGERSELDVHELVVGDIVEISYGERVPADVRIIESIGFKVDNSALTGEAEPVKRSPMYTDPNPLETQNLAFFSASVIEGSAKAIVIRVGNSTFMGRLASLATELDSSETPLSREMWRLNIIITIVSLTFGAIFFTIGLTMGYSISNTIFFVIGIIVGNVPDNLNVALTIILALTAQKLAKKNCLVKHLHAVETLGSCSVICSDKTGTITQNKMSVAHVWFNNTIVEADTSEFLNSSSNDDNNMLNAGRLLGGFGHNDSPGFQALANVASLCSRARFKPGQQKIPVLKRHVEGDGSEAAILKFLELQLGNVMEKRDANPKVCEIPFNSKIKFQVSIHDVRKQNLDDPRYLLVMKGAPERIVEMCKSILIGDVEYDMTDEWKLKIDRVYNELGSCGERVLGFCDCRLPLQDFPIDYQFDTDNPTFLQQQQGMRFVGLMSMIDPPRAAVPESIRKCREAGIKVVMITGDHPITAEAIARAVGIFSKSSKTIEDIAFEKDVDSSKLDPKEVTATATAAVITGADLNGMTNDQLDAVILNYEELVFARTSPEQKYLIVEAFQRLGHIVAVTGDGVNDSPALKRANIGVAMGLSGTDVAKEVADMVLLDDSFETMVFGVENGRLIFDNIKKLIRFTMADNVAEMYCYWVFIILKIPVPMGTIAMLITTSGIDMFSAISLAYEGPEADIMKLKPRNPNTDSLMSRQMLSYAYGQVSVIETFAGFLTYFITFACNGFLPGDLFGGQVRWNTKAVNDLVDSYGQDWTYNARKNLETQAQTAFFIALVVCQVVNVIACKTRRLSIFQQGMRNHCMTAAIIFAPCFACLFVYTPTLNLAVHFIGIGWESWVFCFPFAIFLFVYDELRRVAVRHFNGEFISHEFLT